MCFLNISVLLSEGRQGEKEIAIDIPKRGFEIEENPPKQRIMKRNVWWLANKVERHVCLFEGLKYFQIPSGHSR